MLRVLSLVGITGFWVTMTSLLIQKEYFELKTIQAHYEVLPLHVGERSEYYTIYLGEKEIGFGYTNLYPLEETKGPGFKLTHQNYLSFRILGRENEMLVRGEAELDERLGLHAYETTVRTKDQWTDITGERRGNQMIVTIAGKDSAKTRTVIPVEDPVIHSEAIDYIWTPENLKIGKQGHLRVWNPLLLQSDDFVFQVLRKETLLYEMAEQETFIVSAGPKGMESRTWITPEGSHLQKESPIGLLMKREKPWKIFETMRAKRISPPDLPNLYSVPSNRTVQDPESLVYAKIRIQKPGEDSILENRRQSLEKIRSLSLPLTVEREAFAPYLESSERIQSDHPAIRVQARNIVGDEALALEASLKIMRWVHEKVEPAPTTTIPSAIQVLTVKKGDCNEYTALFTALSRSIGIPTKMIAGLVYQNGRFFYHAWPEVFVGEWVAIDPTFNQAPLDVLHLPLVEGGLREQVDLVRSIGKVKISILEVEEA